MCRSRAAAICGRRQQRFYALIRAHCTITEMLRRVFLYPRILPIQTERRQLRLRAFFTLVGFFTAAGTPAVELDSARDQDPRLDQCETVEMVAKFAPRLKPLWLEALARPEAELKRQAAGAIARASTLGMPGLEE